MAAKKTDLSVKNVLLCELNLSAYVLERNEIFILLVHGRTMGCHFFKTLFFLCNIFGLNNLFILIWALALFSAPQQGFCMLQLPIIVGLLPPYEKKMPNARWGGGGGRGGMTRLGIDRLGQN